MSVPQLEVDNEPRTPQFAPYRALWAGVMRVAVVDWFASLKLDGQPDAKLKRWFYEDRMGPGTFLWICSVLDLQPERVRSAMARGDTYRALREAERAKGSAKLAGRVLR